MGRSYGTLNRYGCVVHGLKPVANKCPVRYADFDKGAKYIRQGNKLGVLFDLELETFGSILNDLYYRASVLIHQVLRLQFPKGVALTHIVATGFNPLNI